MLDATSGMAVIPLLIVAPLIVAAAADERRTAIFAGATVALAIAAGSRHDPVEQVNYWLGRHSHDDVALLLLEYGAYPHSSATGTPAQAAVKTLVSQQSPQPESRGKPLRVRHSVQEPTPAGHLSPRL